MSRYCRWKVWRDGELVTCGEPAEQYTLCEKHNEQWVRARTVSCVVCGQPFRTLVRASGQRYCSTKCRQTELAARARERRQRERVALAERDCVLCGVTFLPGRSDAKFCSGRCRVAAHRADVTMKGASE